MYSIHDKMCVAINMMFICNVSVSLIILDGGGCFFLNVVIFCG